jgi:hypothetical protein
VSTDTSGNRAANKAANNNAAYPAKANCARGEVVENGDQEYQ